MIINEESWEVGSIIYYTDESNQLVKESRIKEIHEEIVKREPRALGKMTVYHTILLLDNGDEIPIRKAFNTKEEAMGISKHLGTRAAMNAIREEYIQKKRNEENDI